MRSTLALDTAEYALHANLSPNPTMLSLDAKSVMTCSVSYQYQLTKGERGFCLSSKQKSSQPVTILFNLGLEALQDMRIAYRSPRSMQMLKRMISTVALN